MSRRIEYIGPVLFPTGYGEAARNHAKALKRVGAQVIARVNSIPNPGLRAELIKDDHEINQMLDSAFWPKDFQPDVTVTHVTPDTFQRAPDRPTIGYSVWELEGLPHGWADACNSIDGLLTCSNFSADLFRRGGVTKPIAVAPHPIDLERFHPLVERPGFRQSMEEAGIKTLFLIVAQWTFRKGVEDALIAYLSEFKREEPVGLALLVWRWGHRWTEAEAIRRAIRHFRTGLNLQDVPRVWYLPDKLPPEALPQLYRASDVVVSASRGEAFGLPIFEAAACVRPSIVTGWGGMWDYLTDEMAYRVPYTMETVHGAGPKWGHYGAWQRWAMPSIDGIRRAMREAHEDPEGRQRKGQRAFEMVADRLTYSVTGKAMLDGINMILDTAQVEV